METQTALSTPTTQSPTTSAPAPLVMNDLEAAAYLGISAHTLRKWRCKGTGPVYCSIGRLKKYRLADLQRYTEEQAVAR